MKVALVVVSAVFLVASCSSGQSSTVANPVLDANHSSTEPSAADANDFAADTPASDASDSGTDGITLEGALALSPDSDGDGVLDLQENCRFVANPDQQDTNQDGIGDACMVDAPIAPPDPDTVAAADVITVALAPPADPYPPGLLPALLLGEHYEIASSYDPDVDLLTFEIGKERVAQLANANGHLYFEGEPTRFVGTIDPDDATRYGVAILGRPAGECLRVEQLSFDGNAELVVANGSAAVEVSPLEVDGVFTIGALSWHLRIGEIELGRGYSPDGSHESLVFPLSAQLVARLDAGDPVDIYYGEPGNPLGVETTELASLRIAPCES